MRMVTRIQHRSSAFFGLSWLQLQLALRHLTQVNEVGTPHLTHGELCKPVPT
jgi:hypothetical protein